MLLYELTEKGPDILATIEKDCKPFLSLIGGDISKYRMFRGMPFSRNSGNIFRKQIRLDDRRPMSTADIKHDRYNHFFQEVYGQPFRNSLFATGDRKMAKYYGYPFVVFPIGNFDWLWSKDVNDLALDIHFPPVAGFHNVPPTQEVIDDKLEFAGYRKNHDLPGAIKSGNEIMIRGKEYYAVRTAVSLKGK